MAVIIENRKFADYLSKASWLYLSLLLVCLILGFYEYIQLEEMRLEGHSAFSDFSSLRQGFMLPIKILFWLGYTFLFLKWLAFSYANLHRHQLRHLEFEQNEAVQSFFIPLINWFKPLSVIRELWIEMEDLIKLNYPLYEKSEVNMLTVGWWLLFFASHWLGGLWVISAWANSNTDALDMGIIYLLVDSVDFIALLFTMRLLDRLFEIEARLFFEINKKAPAIHRKPSS